VVLFDEIVGMDMVLWFPCVVALWIARPFYQVFHFSRSPILSMIDDALHLVFLLPFN
jgi:hypothetical protein